MLRSIVLCSFRVCLWLTCPEIGLHIKCKQMNRKKEAQIINDHCVNGLSYRSLGIKYGEHHLRIYRMIKSNQKKQAGQPEVPLSEDPTLPDDIKQLKEALRKAQLKIELQDIMIDIASKELGVDIRKKSGTRQSE